MPGFNSIDIALPAKGNYMLTVSNDYAVGCLYFICAGSLGNKTVIYPLAKKDTYFELSIVEELKIKLDAGGASGKVYLYQIALL